MKVFFFMCRFPIKLTKICNNNKNDNNSNKLYKATRLQCASL